MKARRGRWVKIAVVAAGIYFGLAAAGVAALHGGVVAARALGRGPAPGPDGLPPIAHLRAVDDKLLAGAQARPEHYRELARVGVTLVVDLRTGASDDPNRDDPALLASLGMDYVRMPVPDGRAPDAATVRRFLDAVGDARGRVFLHCGGGVGRSMTLEAAYEADRGIDPSWLDKLAIGPPSFEQLWFVAAAEPGGSPGPNAAVAAMSRAVDGPRRLWSRLRSRL